MSWEITDEEILHENPWTTFRRRGFKTRSGEKGNYFFIQTNGGGCAMVIPQLPDGRFVMVKTYRFLTDHHSIEFPAGGIKVGQTAEQAARDELVEEVGYEAGTLRLLHVFSPNNGIAIDPSHIFLATNITFVGERRESTEDMETRFYTEAQIDELIKNNEITDGQVLAAWCIYKTHKTG